MIFKQISIFAFFCFWIIIFLFSVFFVVLSTTDTAIASSLPSVDANLLKIEYPFNNTIFPTDIAAPTFKWRDEVSVSKWRIELEFNDGKPPLIISSTKNQWQPESKAWIDIKQRSMENSSELTVSSIDSNGRAIDRQAAIHFTTSNDPVSAPIFYRDVIPCRFAPHL